LKGDQPLFEALDVLTAPPPGGIPQAVVDIFTGSCAGSNCHTGANPALGLSLEPASAEESLVGVPSIIGGGQLRISPGEPENSFIIAKVEGTGAGAMMPIGKPALNADQIAALEAWISGMDATPVVDKDVVDSDTEEDVGDSGPPSDEGTPVDIDIPVVDPVPEEVGVIFQKGCAVAGCHKGTVVAAGLVLTADVAAQNTVNVQSTNAKYGGMLRVKPGDPDGSLLIKKIEGADSDSFGAKMPLVGTLEAEQIQVIRNWISGLDGDTPTEDVSVPSEDVSEPSEDVTDPPEDSGTQNDAEKGEPTQ
jgi:mono/diheme cytochrome c family protein